FAPECVVPAVGQGALAIEIRAGDERLATALRDAVNDDESELCVTCERAALRTLRAGCSAPLGIYAQLSAETMVVEGAFAPPAGALTRARLERKISTLAQAEALGAELGELLNGSNAKAMGVGS
ncbi:MAG: hypothetical protein WBP75_15975, partial [Candidatus Cybelea sp.]